MKQKIKKNSKKYLLVLLMGMASTGIIAQSLDLPTKDDLLSSPEANEVRDKLNEKLNTNSAEKQQQERNTTGIHKDASPWFKEQAIKGANREDQNRSEIENFGNSLGQSSSSNSSGGSNSSGSSGSGSSKGRDSRGSNSSGSSYGGSNNNSNRNSTSRSTTYTLPAVTYNYNGVTYPTKAAMEMAKDKDRIRKENAEAERKRQEKINTGVNSITHLNKVLNVSVGTGNAFQNLPVRIENTSVTNGNSNWQNRGLNEDKVDDLKRYLAARHLAAISSNTNTEAAQHHQNYKVPVIYNNDNVLLQEPYYEKFSTYINNKTLSTALSQTEYVLNLEITQSILSYLNNVTENEFVKNLYSTGREELSGLAGYINRGLKSVENLGELFKENPDNDNSLTMSKFNISINYISDLLPKTSSYFSQILDRAKNTSNSGEFLKNSEVNVFNEIKDIVYTVSQGDIKTAIEKLDRLFGKTENDIGKEIINIK